MAVEVKIMKINLTSAQETSTGFKAKKLRVARLLTQQELADMADVSLGEVDLFERNLPVPLDTKRRILKELWAKKAGSD